MMGGSDYLCVGALDSVGAIVACDGDVLAVDDAETCAHGLVVGDALGIATLDDAHNSIRKNHGELLDDLIVTDNVDHSGGSDEGYSVECRFGEENVGNLDDAFLAELLAVKIVADRDGATQILDT